MANASAKICGICHQDCSSKPRTKDAKGHYFCRECYEKAVAARHASPTHAEPSSASTPQRVEADDVYSILDSLIADPAAAAPAAIQPPPVMMTQTCRKCGTAMEMDSVICPS